MIVIQNRPEPPVGKRVVVLLDAVRLVRVAEHLVPRLLLLPHASSPVVSGSIAASSNFCRLRFEYAHHVQPMKQARNSAVMTPMIHACCTKRVASLEDRVHRLPPLPWGAAGPACGRRPAPRPAGAGLLLRRALRLRRRLAGPLLERHVAVTAESLQVGDHGDDLAVRLRLDVHAASERTMPSACAAIAPRTVSSVTSRYGTPSRCIARTDLVTSVGSMRRVSSHGYGGMMLPGDVLRGSRMCS
jgi:hypothetical protein